MSNSLFPAIHNWLESSPDHIRGMWVKEKSGTIKWINRKNYKFFSFNGRLETIFGLMGDQLSGWSKVTNITGNNLSDLIALKKRVTQKFSNYRKAHHTFILGFIYRWWFASRLDKCYNEILKNINACLETSIPKLPIEDFKEIIKKIPLTQIKLDQLSKEQESLVFDEYLSKLNSLTKEESKILYNSVFRMSKEQLKTLNLPLNKAFFTPFECKSLQTLPDSLLHEALSFLPFKEMALFKRVSPNFSKLYQSLNKPLSFQLRTRKSLTDREIFVFMKDKTISIQSIGKASLSLKEFSIDLNKSKLELASNFTGLTSLKIDNSSRDYSLPDKVLDFEPIKSLTDLTSLHIKGRITIGENLKNLKFFPHLCHLKMEIPLSVDHNIVHLDPLTHLQSLSISFSEITGRGIRSLTALTNLENLSLIHCHSVTALDVAQLRSIKKLRLSNCSRINSNIEHLALLSNLEYLEISGIAHNINLAQLATILPKLLSLKIGFISLTDDNLELLKAFIQLRHLEIFNCDEITDKGVKFLTDLTYLQNLSLGRSKITDVSIANLRVLTHLQSLELSSDEITDTGIRFLADFPSLQILRLSSEKITDNGIGILKDFKKLSHLNLIGSRNVSYNAVVNLKKALPNLKISYLNSTKALETLKKLQPKPQPFYSRLLGLFTNRG